VIEPTDGAVTPRTRAAGFRRSLGGGGDITFLDRYAFATVGIKVGVLSRLSGPVSR